LRKSGNVIGPCLIAGDLNLQLYDYAVTNTVYFNRTYVVGVNNAPSSDNMIYRVAYGTGWSSSTYPVDDREKNGREKELNNGSDFWIKVLGKNVRKIIIILRYLTFLNKMQTLFKVML